MALRCIYTDLDGTLLGRRGSLFADGEGGFSLLQARGLEACHRAGVEVVVKSGRREPQVMEDARLMGQSSYIFEAGCAMVIEVRPFRRISSASWMRASVAGSTEEVASSRTSTAGSKAMARAKDRSCFSPTEKLEPRSRTGSA